MRAEDNDDGDDNHCGAEVGGTDGGLSYGWTRSSEGLRDTNRYKYDTNTIQIRYKYQL